MLIHTAKVRKKVEFYIMVLAKCTVKKSPTDVMESMGRLAIIGYGYVSLFGSDSYSHTVELVYIEGLLCIAHCLHCDAVGSDTGVLKSLGHLDTAAARRSDMVML